ncbi:MAG: hypothetical protein JWQ84_1998 [Mucilaginibacter sp.]|nr:hypothetical protein [Mucilaginibacter sp.]
MKKSLNYLKLWQKKRSELQINDDPQTDWLQMQSLLDQQMPVTNHPVGKNPSVFKGLKLLPKLFIAFSAAAMVYTASHVFLLKKHQHQTKYKTHKSNSILADSVISDSLSTTKDSSANKDSLVLQQQTVTKQNVDLAKPGLDKATTNGPSSNAVVSNTATASANKNNATAAFANKSNSPLLSAQNNTSVPNKTGAQNTTGAQNKAQTAFINLNSSKASGGSVTADKGNKTDNSRSSSTLKSGKNGLMRPGANHGHRSYAPARAIVQTKITSQKIAGNKNDQSAIVSAGGNSDDSNADVVIPSPRVSNTAPSNTIQVLAQNSLKIGSNPFLYTARAVKNKKGKTVPTKKANPSNLDWGILMGVNSSGSFTPAKQNANFYGSAPVDVYFGLFAAYKLNANWAINSQVRLFSPQTITTTYAHANQSKVDSGQSLKITASRKQYAISIPIYLQYKVTNTISFKAGPVINIPVKQTGANSVLQPATIRSDSAYFSKVTGILNATKYDQTINLGFSGGASIQFKRWVFEATYLESLSGYKVTSDLGTYKSNNGTLQITVGFQLNKPKP